VRSCIRSYCGKATNITYSEWFYVALFTQHKMRMRHIVSCGLSGSTVFFHITLQATRFSKQAIDHKIMLMILSTTFVRNILYSKENSARHDHKHILLFMLRTRYSCPIWIKLEFSRQFSQTTQM
jgi:hypothetical protein